MSEKTELQSEPAVLLKFLVMYGGGLGPDVWDAEMEVEADNIREALEIAEGRVKEFRGTVFGIEQSS